MKTKSRNREYRSCKNLKNDKVVTIVYGEVRGKTGRKTLRMYLSVQSNQSVERQRAKERSFSLSPYISPVFNGGGLTHNKYESSISYCKNELDPLHLPHQLSILLLYNYFIIDYFIIFVIFP